MKEEHSLDLEKKIVEDQNHLYIHVNKIYLIKEKCNENRYSLRHVVVYIWLLEVFKNIDRYVTRFNFLNTNYCFNINSKIMGKIALQHSPMLIKAKLDHNIHALSHPKEKAEEWRRTWWTKIKDAQQ